MASFIIKEKLGSGATFASFAKQAEEIKKKRVDTFLPNASKDIWMADDGTMSYETLGKTGFEVHNRPINSWALGQLSTRVGMPSGYAESCITRKHPELAAKNINTWLTAEDRKRNAGMLVREYDGRIDAILSSKYARFDSTDILNVVDEVIDIKDWRVVDSFISDERMHLRLVRDKLLSVPNEDLYPGLFIDSSDVGRTSFNISFGIWKKVCTNGLCIAKVGGKLYHQRHVGITRSEVYGEFKENLIMIPSLISRSEAVIKKAASEKISLSSEKEMEKMISEIRRTTLLNEEDAKKVIELSSEKYGTTRWGITNAITEYAQKFELDDRIRIENGAGIFIA